MRDDFERSPRLTTPRLQLRPLCAGDIPAITEGIGNYDVTRWLARVPYPFSPQDAEDFLEGRVATEGHHWAVDAGAGLVGVVSISEELGYWLARPYWGAGLGFEAVRAAVAHWFEFAQNDRLEAGYFFENTRSARLLDCLGFTPSGTTRQTSLALSQDVESQRAVLSRETWERVRRFEATTSRLRLRELERTDAYDLVRLATPSVTRMVSSLPETLTVAAAKAFIAKRRWQGVPGFLLGVEDSDARLVGCIGCGGEPVTGMMFFGEEHWNKGYATEAGSAFVRELFTRVPLSGINAEHFVDNPASGRALEKMGFRKVGIRTGNSEARLEPAPVVVYRLTRDEVLGEP